MNLTSTPETLQRAVIALCPEVEVRVAQHSRPLSEEELWIELSTCILSSQVPYSLAQAAALAVSASGKVSAGCRPDPGSALKETIFEILNAPLEVEGRWRRYRFPAVKSAQMAAAWHRIYNAENSIQDLLKRPLASEAMRQWWVENIPGMGPKQASMFLRNVGFTHDLAILDRHIVAYMHAVQPEALPNNLQKLASYKKGERAFAEYASSVGYPVGMVDWAIWIVMRVATSSPTRQAGYL